MTMPLATGTYTLLRGVGIDAFGDETDAVSAVAGYEGLVGSVVEVTQSTRRVPDGAPRDVRRFVGRFPGWVDVVDEDRVKDNASGDIYVIESWRRVVNPITGSVVKFSLIQVT